MFLSLNFECSLIPRIANWRIRSHSYVELNCRIQYLKYAVIAIILGWRGIHLAVSTIKFSNLIRHLKRTQFCACSLWKICLSHFCISRQSSPGFNVHFELIWFGEFKTPNGGFLLDDEMMRLILVKTRKHAVIEFHQRHQERATSYDSNYKINKAHWACISYSEPQIIAYFWVCCFD